MALVTTNRNGAEVVTNWVYRRSADPNAYEAYDVYRNGIKVAVVSKLLGTMSGLRWRLYFVGRLGTIWIARRNHVPDAWHMYMDV